MEFIQEVGGACTLACNTPLNSGGTLSWGVPTSYATSPAGFAGLTAGTGDFIGASQPGTGLGPYIASISLAVAETATLGDLLIVALDAAGNIVGEVHATVVGAPTGKLYGDIAVDNVIVTGNLTLAGNVGFDMPTIMNGLNLVGSGGQAGLSVTNNTGAAVNCLGQPGLRLAGYVDAQALELHGGASGGYALMLVTVGADAIYIAPTGGHGVTVLADGTNKHGFNIVGGTAGVCDGIHAVAGTGGVDIRGNINSFTVNALGQLLTTDTGLTSEDVVDGSVVGVVSESNSGSGGLQLSTLFDGSATVQQLFMVVAAILAGKEVTINGITYFYNWDETHARVTITAGPTVGTRDKADFDFAI